MHIGSLGECTFDFVQGGGFPDPPSTYYGNAGLLDACQCLANLSLSPEENRIWGWAIDKIGANPQQTCLLY